MLIRCPQCELDMAPAKAMAAPGFLIRLDQCPECGGIWCDKWELFPIDAAEADRLDPLDQPLLRRRYRLAAKTLYCPRCADELAIFADPMLPADIQLRRCRHCDGIWLKRGQFRRYKDFQKKVRREKMGSEEIAAKMPEIYADTSAWVTTGTRRIFAYPRAAEEDSEIVPTSFASAARLVLQSLARMVLGV